jgi:hypothetical protein
MLENEYDDLIKQINLKLAEATLALKEANILKGKAELKSLVFSSDLSEELFAQI